MEAPQGIPLSELTARIKKAVEGEFGTQKYWVIGEVIAHKQDQKKTHIHYFDLIEKDTEKTLARIPARAWSKGGESIRNFEHYTGQKFQDGIKVLVSVTVEYSLEFGLQLILQEVDVQFTLGQIHLNRQRVLGRLLNECKEYIRLSDGKYYTRNKGLVLPMVMQRIAIISSEKSAGYEDFKHKVENNPSGYRFYLHSYFTTVQGEQNAKGIRDKLIQIFHDHAEKQFDVVVIIRGGGSPMDLLIFDDFSIAQAVAKLPIPVITGIGHQTDQTITDLMAHTSKNAPTGVASFILEHNKKFEDGIRDLQSQMVLKLRQLLADRNLKLANANSYIMQRSNAIVSKNKDSLVILNQTIMERGRRIISQNKDETMILNQTILERARKLVGKRKEEMNLISSDIVTKPRIRVGILKGEISNLVDNLKVHSRKFLMTQKGYVGHYEDKFASAKPEKILKMGFAVIMQNDKPVSRPDKILKGAELSILLADTKINTIVKSKEKSDGREFDL